MQLIPTTTAKAGLVCYKPNAKDERYISDGLAFLSMTACFWPSIIYGGMTIKYTREVPWAATDGHVIYVNPDGMRAAGWGIEEVAFVLAHEACHYVYRDTHMGVLWRETRQVQTRTRVLPYLHWLMNKAQDYRINAGLIAANVGKFPVIGLYDAALSKSGMEDPIDIYDKLWDRHHLLPPEPGFDLHLEPDEQQRQAEARTGEARREQVIAGAIQTAQAAGMDDGLPPDIKRRIGELLNPKVNWQDHLRATMQRAQGVPGDDHAKVNKRMISRPVGGAIVYPGRSKYGCGTVVIGWDTSGSTHKFQGLFFGAMAGIVADLNPERLIVIRCDAKVHDVDELEEPQDLTELQQKVDDDGIGGGGGTRFYPVFDYIRDNFIEPDMLVYLTDTLGTFPQSEPDYPVIWASVLPGKKVPFGTLVEVEAE